ncbi:flagellar basal-body rod protein FlgC [Jatrophihabitans endophyticus]|uniref:Flagellar basal-body rod protein FlgC n=1 Tax=Jatrophihabitans endophyticus TaxID=1206085 RepID=A0A1M5IF00_9ACTN|nr:flagellar basal body rod C-terminal domain-containing protein [Jatrophihabitans endophyticus]SHG26827.1 flagellar basal-body rod protein FlgC [Jatrophihabitans endophyticus]
MFQSITTAGTGLQSYHTWLDTIANNIANVNDTAGTSAAAFHEHYVVLQENGGNGSVGDGVHVAQVAAVSDTAATADAEYDPTNPQADANGDVYRARVDLPGQMGDMIAAQRAFQANANVVDRAKEVYEAAIGIGKGI